MNLRHTKNGAIFWATLYTVATLKIFCNEQWSLGSADVNVIHLQK